MQSKESTKQGEGSGMLEEQEPGGVKANNVIETDGSLKRI